MRTEISQAKRETDYFRANLERSKRLNTERMEESADPSIPIAKKSRKSTNPLPSNSATKRIYEFRQKETDETIKKRKRLEQAQNKIAEPAQETQGTKIEIHTESKKQVKEAKNKSASSTKALKADKRKSKMRKNSKGTTFSNEIDSKSSNSNYTSKLKTRNGSNAEKTGRTEFLRNVFL